MSSSSSIFQHEALFLLAEQNLIINPLRALYWTEQKMLIVSDLHLGKAGHFRKNGIPVPRQVHVSDFQKLNNLIQKYLPETIVFLGDLFHSDFNDEWQDFVFWSNHHKHIHQILVEGNHDILDPAVYEATKMKTCQELILPPFHLTHLPVESRYYNLAGHIHPCVKLFGDGRQGVSFPCFYFGKRSGLFPAFGTFTGNYKIRAKKGDQIFALADDKVIALVG